MLRTFTASVLSVLLVTSLAQAADWPAFRGPQYDGVAAEKTAPTSWSATENVKWKAPLPRPGNGSPIVAAGKVFVTSAEDADGRRRSLYCFDAKEGKQLWVQTVEYDKTMPTHKTNPYCGSTPLCDGERVVVWHASAGLKCYDLEGTELWSRDLGEFEHMWGYATSPILYKDNVILHTGPGQRVFVTAIKISNGETVWENEEPFESKGDRNSDGKYQGSWSTPIIAQVNGQDQIIVPMTTRVNGYDPATGKIVWSCEGVRHGRGDLAYSSPAITGDICFFTGGFSGPAFAFTLGGTGDITEASQLWRKERQPQSIGSPVAVDGYIYRPNAGPGTTDCIDPKTGEVQWTSRECGSQWASIVKVGDLLYSTNQDGTTTVFKPNPKEFEEVSSNELKDGCNATPAVGEGNIFIRTDKNLFCIGE